VKDRYYFNKIDYYLIPLSANVGYTPMRVTSLVAAVAPHTGKIVKYEWNERG